MRNFVALVVLIVLVAAACSSATETSTTDAETPDDPPPTSITIPESTESGIVTGVINGDTVEVMINDERKVIRLAGIRAPRDEECYAAQASLALSELAAGRSVAISGDATDTDGTPLRYLIIDEDVPVLVNVELVDRGAAAALEDHTLAGDFLRVNAKAYASGRGMWGTFVCGHPKDAISPDRPLLQIGGVRTGAASPDPVFVDITNNSYTEISVGGWTMRDAADASRFTFPGGTEIAPGEVLSVAISCDAEDAPGLTWCGDPDMLAGGGNTLIIQDALGNVVDRYVYGTSTSGS